MQKRFKTKTEAKKFQKQKTKAGFKTKLKEKKIAKKFKGTPAEKIQKKRGVHFVFFDKK